MYLLPLVEIQKGESVHVLQGRPSEGEARPLMDPVEVVNRFVGLGARGFHIVDVDNAIDPKVNNDEALVRIMDNTHHPIVVGGGVRSLKRIQELLDTGARRVLVGSMGVIHPVWLKEAALVFEDRLIACIDVRGSELLIKGRTEAAEQSLESFVGRVDDLKLAQLHVTTLAKDGSGIELVEQLAGQLKTPISFQGAVRGPADLQRLDRAGVKGTVIGAEVYDGRLSFTELDRMFRPAVA